MTHTAHRALTALTCAMLTSALTWQAPSAGAEGENAGSMMLVLDSSGSMKQQAQGGATKIDAAKKALTAVIGGLPADTSVGLRVFGASVENAGDPGACTDSQLVVPTGTGNRAALQAAVTTYQPYGETPIGYALQEAAKDLGPDGKRSIVLVSDGIATCQPDPCDVAKTVAAQGIDLTIDVVGMSVDAPARKQLQCIATAGHGKYYDANTADQLAGAIEQAKSTHVASKAQLQGKAVAGTASPIGAPVITSGDWRDTIGGKGKAAAVKHYTLHRTIPGSSLEAAVVFQPAKPTDPNGMATFADRIDLEVTAGEQTCGSGVGTGERPLQGAAALAPSDHETAACREAQDLVLAVKHDSTDSSAQDRPVQIRVTEVPPATNAESLPGRQAYVEAPKANANPGRATRLRGGSSLAAAVPITSDRTYADSLLPGDVQLYKVPVGYGQQLSVQGLLPDASAAARQELQKGQPTVFSITIFDPAGMRVSSSRSAYLGAATTIDTGTIRPITFRRTYLTNGNEPWLAGYYTVVVGLHDGATQTPVPFAVSARVSGEITGQPVFANPTEAGSTQPPSAHPTTRATEVASGAAGSQATGGGGTPVASTAAEPPAAQRSDNGSLPVVLGCAGAVLVAAGAGLAWHLMRRRQRPGR